MQYKSFKDIKLSKLGLGNMRLPSIDDDPSKGIDWKRSHEIMEYAYNNGINYFDTAYVYNGGESERCLGAGMKKFNRETFYIATKFFIGASKDYKKVFQEQLERLQTDYIDFYLCHCILDSNADEYLNSGCIEYFDSLKKQGKIKYLGFSSHASVETLKKFASAYKWDFAQIQLNYYDMFYNQTMEEYKVLDSLNIPIMVMEPVRGGRLASLTEGAESLLKEKRPDLSIASWALRYVETLPRVQVILSGMSSMDQIKDNVNTFSDPNTLNEEELKVLKEAGDMFRKQLQVPCTGCRYCTDTCPAEINIPEYMKLYNAYKLEGKWALNDEKAIKSNGRPIDCISCEQCMAHCPQHIKITNIIQNLAELLK